MITYLLFYRIPRQITIQGKKTQYDVHWNSTVEEMKRRVVKKERVAFGSMVLVYDGKSWTIMHSGTERVYLARIPLS